MQKAAIVGASGFVGSYLQTVFQNKGYEIVGLNSDEMQKDPQEITNILEGSSVVINLAGAPIIHRWSEAYRRVLYDSRIGTTKKLVEAMQSMKDKPDTFFRRNHCADRGSKGDPREIASRGICF
ncbi:MAG: NAD-dependent epimerase/dehydratase family protein [Campylobacterota bacterium]|nr:NAD-dependent epimerase/dehydratase family protein [Campylobacterota bacterium]